LERREEFFFASAGHSRHCGPPKHSPAPPRPRSEPPSATRGKAGRRTPARNHEYAARLETVRHCRCRCRCHSSNTAPTPPAYGIFPRALPSHTAHMSPIPTMRGILNSPGRWRETKCGRRAGRVPSDISGSRRVCRRPARAAILRRGHRASPRSPIDTYYRRLQQNMWRFVPKVWRTRTPKSTYCERFPMKKGPVHLVQGCQAAVSGGSGARVPWQYRPKHA